MTVPFKSYPGSGREPMGPPRDPGTEGARHGYALDLMRRTGQTRCAYCDIDLTSSYEIWLMVATDHVVPSSLCKTLGISAEWRDDAANRVLACRACNEFANPYKPPTDLSSPASFEAFCDLRDWVFADRREKILTRRETERDFFASRPWVVKSGVA